MKSHLPVLLLAALIGTASAGPLTPAGERLVQTIDALDVENHWPAVVHVHWESGEPDGRPERTPGKHTHCSAFVVATYKNHHDDKPGHIAIVRPNDTSARELRENGPQVTQAGGTNYRSVSLKQGFAGHPAAWTRREVRYYAHNVEAQ
jgi:hypothetical protein